MTLELLPEEAEFIFLQSVLYFLFFSLSPLKGPETKTETKGVQNKLGVIQEIQWKPERKKERKHRNDDLV